MADDDDARPIERSARKRPTQGSSSSLLAHVPHKPRAVDPRFDPMYGKVDAKQFQQNYKFLAEQRDDEQKKRIQRVRQLNAVIRRLELEAQHDNTDELDEYDMSADEHEIFLRDVAEDDTNGRHAALRELALMKRRTLEDLQNEKLTLQRESTVYKAQSSNTKANERALDVKKRIMKEEATAVKEGRKLKPYFPKRQVIRERIVGDRFDQLNERGGKLMVDKYVERKTKRR